MSTEKRGTFGFGSLAMQLATIASVVSLVALTSTGCGLLKKKGEDDAGAVAAADEAGAATDEAGAAAVAEAGAAAPVAAVNVADVARFPDEVPVANVAATIARPTNVRDIPSVGKVSAALAKGGTVTEISQRGTAFLITFANPANQQQLMGWVGQEAFTPLATADAGIRQLQCGSPEVAVHVDTDICVRVCRVDGDCPGGTLCRGTSPPAQKVVGGKLTDVTNVCLPGVAAPAPTAVATAAAVRVPDVAVSQGGRCPAGSTIAAKDLQCHRNCVGAGAFGCDAGFRCTKCPTLPNSVCVANGAAASFCK